MQTDKKNKARVQNEDGNLDFKLKWSEEIKVKLFRWKHFSIFFKAQDPVIISYRNCYFLTSTPHYHPHKVLSLCSHQVALSFQNLRKWAKNEEPAANFLILFTCFEGGKQLLKDFKLRKSHQLECHNLLLIILITFIFVFAPDVDALHDTCRCAQLLRSYFLVVAKSFILCSELVMSIFLCYISYRWFS